MWELPDNNFKAPLIMMMHEVRVTTLEMNGKLDILNKRIEGFLKNQTENFKLLDTITKVESPLEGLKSRMEMRKKSP